MLSRFIHRLTHSHPMGIASLAEALGIKAQVLRNRLNPNNYDHRLSVEDAELVADNLDANIDMAEYFAHKANAIVIELPDQPAVGDMHLLDAYMDVINELGSLSKEFKKAYADGRITQQEFKELHAQVMSVITRVMAFDQLIQEVST